MKNEITIKLIKKDDHYEWIGLTPEGKTYMWGAAYDDPFEMLQPINTALFEEMWDQGCRKVDSGKKKMTIEDSFSNVSIMSHKSREKIRDEIIRLNTIINSYDKYISKQQQEINDLHSKKDSLEDENAKLKELKEQLSQLLIKQEEISVEKQYYEYASTLLKDTGIKTKIIRQYLPIMNKLINKYLTAMDFFVNFNINENFEETIKSRHRDDFAYANFSEGEKMRIDLALLFTWRQIAKLKNSTNTNLLILDEVFDSSLDGVGTEEFLKLIHEMGHDTNIFVISHKGDQLFDKFRSVIKFEKHNNFSRIAK